MATTYFNVSNFSEITTPNDSSEDEEGYSTPEVLSSVSTSSGELTRFATNESIEIINSSRVENTGIEGLTDLLSKATLGPKILNTIKYSEVNDENANNDGIATPQLFTLEEARKILEKQKTLSNPRHVSIIKKINKVLKSNEVKINENPKVFGFKFISLCLASALGGRREVRRCSRKLDKYHIDSIIPEIADCTNDKNGLNISTTCCIGHIILLYWDQIPFRKAMIKRFGPLDEVAENIDFIRKKIGGRNLWDPKTVRVSSSKKKMIIEEYEERFQKDEENFEKILSKIGIEI